MLLIYGIISLNKKQIHFICKVWFRLLVACGLFPKQGHLEIQYFKSRTSVTMILKRDSSLNILILNGTDLKTWNTKIKPVNSFLFFMEHCFQVAYTNLFMLWVINMLNNCGLNTLIFSLLHLFYFIFL